MKPRVPTAKPGDEAVFQINRCAVAQVGLTDPHNEICAIGIIPNTKDGARVFVGAALRRPEVARTGVMAHQVAGALLDPAEATLMASEIIGQARRAAVLRGVLIKPEPTPALLDLISFLIDTLPNDARMAIIDQAMDKVHAELEAKPEKVN